MHTLDARANRATTDIETRDTVCRSSHVDWRALFLLLVIEASIVIWNAFDHALPYWDTAAHRVDSLIVFDQLQHPHFRSIDWYRSLFAVSPFYPPLFYFVSASLKFVLGRLAETELASNLLYVAILFGSVYWAARQTFKNQSTALIAAGLIFLYPLVYWTAHCVLLECASTAMVALALSSFLWWAKEPRLSRSLLVGIIFGLVTLTKTTAATFLVGPVVLAACIALRHRDYARLGQLCFVASAAALVVLPWAVLAYPVFSKSIASIQSQNLSVNDPHNSLIEFSRNLWTVVYQDLPAITGPLLYGCFLIALLSGGFSRAKTSYLLAGVISGIVLCSSFRWVHAYRYAIPVTVVMAVITAEMCTAMWSRHHLWLRSAIIAIGLFAFVRLVYLSFTPYPVRLPAWLDHCLTLAQVDVPVRHYLNQVRGITLRPTPDEDWGVKWALSIIERSSRFQSPCLMVVPSTDTITSSPYCYLSKLYNDKLGMVDCREYTVLGDRVRYNPILANLIEWYVLTTGDQGRPLIDSASKAAYDRWCAFVRTSGHCELRGSKRLPDGSLLQLYQLKQSILPGKGI
jgi:4-amino-4-deoxy-L-arabinose transferase-like glycosyltransferase